MTPHLPRNPETTAVGVVRTLTLSVHRDQSIVCELDAIADDQMATLRFATPGEAERWVSDFIISNSLRRWLAGEALP